MTFMLIIIVINFFLLAYYCKPYLLFMIAIVIFFVMFYLLVIIINQKSFMLTFTDISSPPLTNLYLCINFHVSNMPQANYIQFKVILLRCFYYFYVVTSYSEFSSFLSLFSSFFVCFYFLFLKDNER